MNTMPEMTATELIERQNIYNKLLSDRLGELEESLMGPILDKLLDDLHKIYKRPEHNGWADRGIHGTINS